jgi:hypothetical protein
LLLLQLQAAPQRSALQPCDLQPQRREAPQWPALLLALLIVLQEVLQHCSRSDVAHVLRPSAVLLLVIIIAVIITIMVVVIAVIAVIAVVTTKPADDEDASDGAVHC